MSLNTKKQGFNTTIHAGVVLPVQRAAKSDLSKWVGILTAVLLAGGEAYLSRDAAQDMRSKSTQSEDTQILAIESNARAITAGSKGIEAIQADREKLEGSFRKAINALNTVARQHEVRLNALSVSIRVEATLRERRESEALRRPASSVQRPPTTVESFRPMSAEVAALRPPAEVGGSSAEAVRTFKGYAQPRLVPRVWAKRRVRRHD